MMLQMMQEMHNCVIYFKHRLVTDPKPILASPLRIMAQLKMPQSSNSYLHHWCNFCDEVHNPTTHEPFLIDKQ